MTSQTMPQSSTDRPEAADDPKHSPTAFDFKHQTNKTHSCVMNDALALQNTLQLHCSNCPYQKHMTPLFNGLNT